MSELQQALALKGDYVEAHWALAQTYEALGYPKGAILEYHAVAWFAEEAEIGCKAQIAAGKLGGIRPPFPAWDPPPETNPSVVLITGDRRWQLRYCVTQFFGDLPAQFATMSTTVWLCAEDVVACVYSNGYTFLFDLEHKKYSKGYATDPQGQVVDAPRLLKGAGQLHLPPLALDFPTAPAVRSWVDEKGVFLEPQLRPYFTWKSLYGDWQIILSMAAGGWYEGDLAPHDEVWLFDREQQRLAFVYPSLPLPQPRGMTEDLYFARGLDLRVGRALGGRSGAYWMSWPAYQDWKSNRDLSGPAPAETESAP